MTPVLASTLVALVLAVVSAVHATVTARTAVVDVRRRLSVRRRPPPEPRQPPRRSLVAFAAGAVVAVVHPLAGAAVAAAVVLPPVLRRRRLPRAAEAAAVEALPDAVELLAVAARAGLPVAAALGAVAGRAPPPWGSAFAAVLARCRRGERLGDAVDEVAAVGDVGQPLRSVLRAAADDGADLVAGLDRLSADARDLRRRRAEEAARRIPVRLLLPLVACSLPAFALLTIVPIVVVALEALDLST
jgi:tight adherence protein C